MKILYLASARIPTEKAHGLQIMKMCEAFARAGHDVELVVPRRKNLIKADSYEYYGVGRIFRITYLPALGTVSLGRIGFFLHRLSFSISVWWYQKDMKVDVVYGRDEIALLALAASRVRVWEAHEGRWNLIIKMVVKRAARVVVITHALKDFFIQKNVSASLLCVAPDAVSYEQFALHETKEDARAYVGLPIASTIVMYTGHLYSWKGVDILATTARLLPKVLVVFVGGTPKDCTRFEQLYGSQKNIILIGTQKHEEIPHYLRSADVLVLPNTAYESLSRLYTSPMKLFEYMASGRPIVASDLPSIREIIDESCATFAQPDDAGDLARVLTEILLESNELVQLKVARAQERARQYSWEGRARLVLDSII